MKKLILAAAMTMTAASAFAQYSNRCQVERFDLRTGRQIGRLYEAYDCKEALKACSKDVSLGGYRNTQDCRKLEIYNPGPQFPGPQNPGPQYPGPQYPGPQTGYDAYRSLNQGESVIFRNQFATVIGIGYSGTYAVRSNDVFNTITNNVRREELAVRTGCNLNLCANESVINISTSNYAKVIGLSANNTFVVQANDVFNTITSNMDRSRIAKTSGCVSSRYAQICVGNQVIDQYNRYASVIGVQEDGRVVLRANDVFNTITTNVNPANLVITR